MKIIIFPAEKILNAYRNKSVVFKNKYITEYNKYLPLISKAYSEAYYWHGTGRYHYGHNHTSRYEKSNSEKLLDILKSIIHNDGLTPHYDPWIKIGGKYIYTTSLTCCRMHARLYADTHRYEKSFAEFEYGSTRYWLFLLMILVSFAIIRHPIKSARDFVKMLASRSALESAKTWIKAVRRDYKFKILKFWQIFELKSDIPLNYPLLFGIKKEIVKTISVTPFMDKFESRTDQQIQLTGFTHIEVPLNRVKETQDFLLSNAINLPVIPLEFGEIYCSQYSAQKLIYNPSY